MIEIDQLRINLYYDATTTYYYYYYSIWRLGHVSGHYDEVVYLIVQKIHNQIDYIVAPRRMTKMFTDAKSVAALRHRTDHSMVMGKVICDIHSNAQITASSLSTSDKKGCDAVDATRGAGAVSRDGAQKTESKTWARLHIDSQSKTSNDQKYPKSDSRRGATTSASENEWKNKTP